MMTGPIPCIPPSSKTHSSCASTNTFTQVCSITPDASVLHNLSYYISTYRGGVANICHGNLGHKGLPVQKGLLAAQKP